MEKARLTHFVSLLLHYLYCPICLNVNAKARNFFLANTVSFAFGGLRALISS